MSPRESPLGRIHAARGAKRTEFGGWEMPVRFDSIAEEHRAVRESVGIFDVSHMGEIEVRGADATALMQRLTTNDVTRLDVGEAQYTTVTTAEGIMLDDTVVYRLDDEEYLFVPNAGQDAGMCERWRRHRDRWGLEATVQNATEEWAMVALQGPDAPDLIESVVAEPVGDLPRFAVAEREVAGVDCLVATTGYTGESGVEVLCPWETAATVYEAIDARPCGLGARDTLRIEMGFLLSGQDFDPETNPRTPYEAGVGFTVSETEFVGREALEGFEIEEEFAGLRLLDRAVPRHGHEIHDADGDRIGTVASGTISPTLSEPIALGYLPTDYAEPGARLRVSIRGERKRAKVVSVPFLS